MVGLIELELFRVGETKSISTPLLFVSGERSSLGEEILAGSIKIFQRLLQRLSLCASKLQAILVSAPSCQLLAHLGIADELFFSLVVLLLKRQCLVVYKPRATHPRPEGRVFSR